VERGNMEDKPAHRRLLNGVYVIGAKHSGRVNAMTAAWVTRVAFEPPLIAVAIGPERYTHDMIAQSGYFTINILKKGQEKIGAHFGLQSGRDTDKMKGIKYREAKSGAPILEDAPAWIECKVIERVSAGDHTIFIGEVVNECVREDFEPLPYRSEDYYG